jgi:hypothetical protein
MPNSQDEIYSTMFTSLKHPVRRKILRMLADKPMTFMEMVEHLSVSSSHLTYHLESLGELVFKMDNGKYKLSTFGQATVSAMKDVEEPPETKPKQRLKLNFKWKTIFTALLVAVLLLTIMSAVQFHFLNQLSASQQSLAAENQQLLAWGIGTNNVGSLIQNVAQIDTTQYKITLLSNTLQYRTDMGVAEEVLKYSLTSARSNLDVDFRFRDNHLSRYQLSMIESAPIFSQTQPSDILQIAKDTLNRYKAYSGDDYLDEMSSLLSNVNKTANMAVTQGNMKLEITVSATDNIVEFLWMYTENGLDFNAKSLRLTFQNNILTELTDGYSLFTVANTNLNINQDQAVAIARDYAKTYVWNFAGQRITDFNTEDQPVSIQFVPHPRGNSVALVPYWYIILRLDRVYVSSINEISVGLYADTGEVVDVQLMSGTNIPTT